MSAYKSKLALTQSVAKQAFASDGSPFDPRTGFWGFRTLSSAVNIDFRQLRASASNRFVADAKIVMKLLVETKNLQTVKAAFAQFKILVTIAHERRNTLVDAIDAEDIALWCARGNTAYIGQLRPVFGTWKTLKCPGVSQETHDFISRIRVQRTTDKEAVRTWNPDAGAYRPAEDAALKTALDAAFNNGAVSLYDYAIVRTFRGLGMRSAQLAAMKVGDLRESGGLVEMRIPLAKRRGIPERGGFMPWKPITKELADILFLHIAENITPRVGANDKQAFAQLFPPKKVRLLTISQGIEAHQGNDNIYAAFSNVFRGLSVVSPITGRQIVVTPTRERHTVLTGLAMLGCNALEIAANAGHADSSSCEPYVDASIGHFQRMERLVGKAFIPLADRFLGKVVRQQQDEAAQQDPESVLRGKDMTGVGSCETGGCEAIAAGVAPVACYTCRRFRAWADAPHEDILTALLEQQQKLTEAGHVEVAGTRTATIVAITDLLGWIPVGGRIVS